MHVVSARRGARAEQLRVRRCETRLSHFSGRRLQRLGLRLRLRPRLLRVCVVQHERHLRGDAVARGGRRRPRQCTGVHMGLGVLAGCGCGGLLRELLRLRGPRRLGVRLGDGRLRLLSALLWFRLGSGRGGRLGFVRLVAVGRLLDLGLHLAQALHAERADHRLCAHNVTDRIRYRQYHV